ncbi:hypothetical protein HF521_008094 [Silurus meridionalis]|uniref:Peptidase C80 domain-containing protein n=1 Tax=Silurus meridionalis TaxID=175797 RepID=A0A8T0AQT2_SILME|nr:hypothetical protein HF521_008094 [Silurus meridionalis]
MHLGGYKAEKVADIIEHMNIKENQIKTISVVACEVGSDETFRSTLLKELHARSIKTKLHLRSSLLQVTHTGQKITAEINPDGLIWKHNDDSKKVVLKLDRNEHVHSELQKTFGEKVQKLHVKPDSVTIRDGEFQCELVFDTNLAEVKKWKFPLPEESKILMEKLKTNVKEVSEMTTIHTTSVHLEEAGKLLGVTGLLLSAQGAVKAFEHGDIKTGVVATLQTIHGVTGMTLAALGQQVTVVAENKAMKAISTGLKNPAFKRTMGIVMPVTGIAFGIYNIAEDLKRGGAQGMIDLTLDTLMVDLDIVEFVQPELAPIIIPVNLVLGAIRMTIDNIYLDIEYELKILPSDATVLDKIRAVIVGFGEAVFHTMLDIESFFYTIPYREIENGHRIVKEISDYHEYFSKTEVQAGRKAINFAGDGVLFDISKVVFSSVKLVAKGVNMMSKPEGQLVDTNEYLLLTVTNIVGSPYDDRLIGNSQKNLIDGGGGQDFLMAGNAQGNTFYPRSGSDFLQGRGGQDLYIVTPGLGVKIIDNSSPDMALDTLFFNVNYSLIIVKCFDTNLLLLVNGNKEVWIINWFKSKMSQHLQVQTADGIIFSFQSSKCTENMKLPKSMDYRKSQPGQKMLMNRWEFVSVEKMYGSPGFDIMVGNNNDNWLDPFTGGAFMEGGEGMDTYIVKPEYGIRLEIDNFANDEKIDTVLFQAEFLSTPFRVDGENDDIIISAINKGENMMVKLRNYRAGQQHQHLSFQSADGVHFRVRSPVANQSEVLQDPWIEAFKVILKDKQSDCYIDLSSQENLSTVYRVQGCSDQSNDIQGNDQDNTLIGGSKNDVLEGGDGHDSLIGGDGNDILIGSQGNDTLYGGDGDDTLLGSIGWDIFVPGLGADVIDGGPGQDTVLYQGDHEKGEGVYVSLLSGEGHQADAEGDVLKDVENVIGTIYSDILVSGYEPALLKGSDGDDVLVSVTAGDYLIGGEGRDIYMITVLLSPQRIHQAST